MMELPFRERVERCAKVKQLSVADMFARAIDRISRDLSVSDEFDF